ncbi:MAG: ATP-binding protein [Candidatus Altiarchaeota archaeon]
MGFLLKMRLDEIESTREVEIPKSPIDRVIGQEKAIEKVSVAVRQRRHLLLVGPPGVGKSMLAQAMASHLTQPNEQVSVLHNPNNPHRPLVEVLNRGQVEREKCELGEASGRIASAVEVPSFVSERLGYRCSNCGSLSPPDSISCPACGANKYSRVKRGRRRSPYTDLITDVFEVEMGVPDTEISTTRIGLNGIEEAVVYQRVDDDNIRVLDQAALEGLQRLNDRKKRNIIVPIDRKIFIHATGASETELLGDVRHDPYGSHPEIGTPAYLRVVPGSVHEAHEGVLFIDELPHLEKLQNFILTAMQERKFPITGRNPHSAGASVKVVDVPCDFLFVGACNISEVGGILPPLRSRIIGNGYEILLNTSMPDTPENRDKILQFVAQEIVLDGRIPHASREVVEVIIDEAKRRASLVDEERNALTLRLRDLGGVVRMAGDLAVLEDAGMIEGRHIRKSLEDVKSIEHQLQERYGTLWKGLEKDKSFVLGQDRVDRSYG